MFKRALFLLSLLLSLLITNAFLFPYPAKNVPDGPRPEYGFSYSFENAAWYGLDPKGAYQQLLDCCGFSWVRVPFYWNGKSSRGAGNIDDLEFAITEAKKRNIKVVVALGLKTPYYPEYHLPKKIAEKLEFGQTIDINHLVAKDVLAIDRQLVTELSKHDNVSYWQVENEPFLANINNWKIDKSLVEAEVETVRLADSGKRPIILTHVGPSAFDNKWKKLVPILKPGDVLGVNAYFKTQGVNLIAFSIGAKKLEIPWPEGFVWPVQSWVFFSPNFEGMRKSLGNSGIGLWVMEMQADPYVRTLDDANRAQHSFSASEVKKAAKFLRQSRIKSIGFWGAPFWLYREKLGDSSWKNSVLEITK